ncbi:MAG: leucine-rich repeat domain-containing protein [Ruminococcus sp.]|nr:leucine-rich repeat domain-containing protein [Ruminococcus sp.]MDE7138465.1 leucine-rich repeat domain-containing protein [Ruminococcus sp.]
MGFEIENGILVKYTHEKGVTEITIPENVTAIKDRALYNCSSLIKIKVNSDNKTYCDIDGVLFSKDKKTLILCPDGKSGDYTIPDCVTTIGEEAFEWCIKLTSITIPNNVTNIKDRAFYNCSSLMQIKVNSNNQTYCDIDGVLFSKDKKKLILCPNGKSGNYIIPDSVTTIVSRAFKWCLRLTSIVIPKNTTNIEENAFEWCNYLTEIKVNNDNQTYCDIDGILFSKDKKSLIFCLRSKSGNYTIPNGVTNINNSAFEWCVRLNNITIPDSVTTIGNHAFECCCNLEGITIPNNVNIIGDKAFYNCISLTDVTIPDSVQHIGNSAFFGCRNLKKVSLPQHFKIFPEQAKITYR